MLSYGIQSQALQYVKTLEISNVCKMLSECKKMQLFGLSENYKYCFFNFKSHEHENQLIIFDTVNQQINKVEIENIFWYKYFSIDQYLINCDYGVIVDLQKKQVIEVIKKKQYDMIFPGSKQYKMMGFLSPKHLIELFNNPYDDKGIITLDLNQLTLNPFEWFSFNKPWLMSTNKIDSQFKQILVINQVGQALKLLNKTRNHSQLISHFDVKENEGIWRVSSFFSNEKILVKVNEGQDDSSKYIVILEHNQLSCFSIEKSYIQKFQLIPLTQNNYLLNEQINTQVIRLLEANQKQVIYHVANTDLIQIYKYQ